jgi:hypothetical protein
MDRRIDGGTNCVTNTGCDNASGDSRHDRKVGPVAVLGLGRDAVAAKVGKRDRSRPSPHPSRRFLRT